MVCFYRYNRRPDQKCSLNSQKLLVFDWSAQSHDKTILKPNTQSNFLFFLIWKGRISYFRSQILYFKVVKQRCFSFQTLPNGERLSLPPNVRIMFEVHDLKYATPATVSRCGMVWFSEDVLKTEMIFENFMTKLQRIPLEEGEDDFRPGQNNAGEDIVSPTIKVCTPDGS